MNKEFLSEDGSEFKLEIQNFQRIRKASLTFHSGINVVVGATNSGKTAIFRALQAVIFNSLKESHVSRGTQKSLVRVTYKGNTVAVRRDLSNNSQVAYKINNELYQKVGRVQLPEVSDLLKIQEVEVEDIKVRLNFVKQMSFPFLLDKTPTQLFKFIAGAVDERIFEALANMRKDLQNLNKEINYISGSLENAKTTLINEKEKITYLEDYLPYAKKIVSIKESVDNLNKLEKYISSYELEEKQIKINESKINKVSEVLNILSSKTSKNQSNLDNLISLNTYITNYNNNQNEVVSHNNNLLKIQGNKVLNFPDKKIEGQIQELKSNFNLIYTINQKIKNYVGEQNIINKIEEELSLNGKKKSVIDSAFSKDKSDSIKNLNELNALKEQLEVLLSDFKREENKYIKLEKEHEDIVKKSEVLEGKLNQYDVCPFCGNKIDGGKHYVN